MRLARTGPRRLLRNAPRESRQLAAKVLPSASPRVDKEIPPLRRSAEKHSTAHLPISISVYAKIGRAQQPCGAVTADDLAVDLGNDETQSGSPTASDEARPQDAGADAAIEGTPAEVAAGADLAVRADAGVLDDRFAERQPIPMKWHRLSPGAWGISIWLP